jgi:hypothetical protein
VADQPRASLLDRVQDNGEPNKGADTFSIAAGTYQAGGNVQNGNVQIHKQ